MPVEALLNAADGRSRDLVLESAEDGDHIAGYLFAAAQPRIATAMGIIDISPEQD